MVFSEYLELHSMIFTELFCWFPLGLIDCIGKDFIQPFLSSTFWVLHRFFTLCFWFDLNHKLFICPISLSDFHVEVWKVSVYSTIFGWTIWYYYFFTTPLNDRCIFIAVDHKFAFPEWTINHLSWVTPVFVRVHWFILTFVRLHV